jgi:hypothetical protein
MPDPPEYEESAALLRRIAELLYTGPQRSEPVPVQEIYDKLGGHGLSIDAALKKMERSELISLDLRGAQIDPLGHGKLTFAQSAIAEVVLGRTYIARKFSRAVVHIIVQKEDGGESGATGFFVSDPPNSLVTAEHVVRNRKILRLLDDSDREVPCESPKAHLGPDDLDIAIIECRTHPDVEPIRIEWKSRAASPPADLIVLGYPKIAGVYPGLHHLTAQLQQVAIEYPSGYDSLIISATQPGCSGGPVLDMRGFAIGIVKQENRLENEEGVSSFFSATPAHYLSKLV